MKDIDALTVFLNKHIEVTGASRRRKDKTLVERELRGLVADHLPSFMWPSRIHVGSSLPQTLNGKVDRNALSEIDLSSRNRPRLSRANNIVDIVLSCWAEFVDIQHVNINSHFFFDGGNSLSALEFTGRLESLLRRQLSNDLIFQFPILSQYAQKIAEILKADLPYEKIEADIVEAFGQYLGLTLVYRTDDFFDQGGNSISVIGMCNELKKLGYFIGPADVYQLRTVSHLAEYIKSHSKAASEANYQLNLDSDALFELLPLQKYYFHFFQRRDQPLNPNFVLKAGIKVNDLDLEILKKAIDYVASCHPSLASMFVDHDGSWKVKPGRDKQRLLSNNVVVVTPTSPESLPADVPAALAHIQALLSLNTNTFFYAAVILGEEVSEIHFALHHLITDAISMDIFLEDLEAAYSAYKQGARPTLVPETTNTFAWAERLQQYAKSDESQLEKQHWYEMTCQRYPTLPHDVVGKSQACEMDLVIPVGPRTTQYLFHPFTASVRPVDLLLATLFEVTQHALGVDELWLTLSRHGRSSSFRGIDLSRTVGWLATSTPVKLRAVALPAHQNSGEQLLALVTSAVNEIPAEGIAFFTIRHSDQKDALVDALDTLARKIELSVNFLVSKPQFGGVFEEIVATEDVNDGNIRSSSRTTQIRLVVRRQGQAVVISWTFNPHYFLRERVDMMAQRLVENLESWVFKNMIGN